MLGKNTYVTQCVEGQCHCVVGNKGIVIDLAIVRLLHAPGSMSLQTLAITVTQR